MVIVLGDRRPNLGESIIVGLGVFFLVAYLAYMLANQTYLQGPLWLVPLSLFLMGVLSLGLMYGGYWLAGSDFSDEQVLDVTIWCFTGLIGSLALTFWPIFYQRLVGVTVEDPIFILLVSAGIGANAGIVAGISQVRSERRLEHVQHVRDSLEFLNRLLRHNVLNAVNIIQGNAEMLEKDTQSETTVSRAKTIEEQTNKIDELIQNTRVLIQRVENEDGRDRINFTSIVADEVHSARETYEEAIIESDLESNVEIRADPLMSAVVENLVRNAITHNDRSTPRVDITLRTEKNSAILQVADNGPGIPDEEKQAVIDPGAHGDHGLGLYLVHTLVSQHDGKLSFEDNDPRGTIVTVELPLDSAAN